MFGFVSSTAGVAAAVWTLRRGHSHGACWSHGRAQLGAMTLVPWARRQRARLEVDAAEAGLSATQGAARRWVMSDAQAPAAHSAVGGSVKVGAPDAAQDNGSKRMRVRRILEADEAILGTHVKVNGWVRTVRDQKQFAFINVNDGSNVTGIQIVVPSEKLQGYAELMKQLSTGCSVAVLGTVVESPGKGQKYEIRADDVILLGGADASFPLQKKRHGLEFLRTIAHLRPRTNSIGAAMRVRSAMAQAIHAFFAQRDFVYLHTPILTSSDCEGAGEMFRVTSLLPEGVKGSELPLKDDKSGEVEFKKDFFGKSSFLTVSGQLGGEVYASALTDIYTFGPTFRAENSNTTRHLAEFWMIEPEMAFVDLSDVMENAEAMIKYVLQHLRSECGSDLEFFDQYVQKGLLEKLDLCLREPFGRISYTDAIEELNKAVKEKNIKFEFGAPVWGSDLQTEHERYLAEKLFQKPVFVYDYPSEIKAFYMKFNDHDDGRTVSATDLLVPGIGELIGGSAREHRLEVLKAKMKDFGLDEAAYWWYLDLRRYGTVKHGGYGLGFERFVQFCTGMENIRDVIPFPRYPGQCEF
ncbi:Asparagine--tRNA ligase [Porphyridium purpureum]|uniref:asparagine--tRNA ligase n=1 Tax=Porphyridium purpureum TaxID=35688 RepID=A0A5J4YUS7_PORPP|nr:Asparagine--tRNA ligase [Porphyridium purpureum]|eukprot:POR2331..scf227_4